MPYSCQLQLGRSRELRRALRRRDHRARHGTRQVPVLQGEHGPHHQADAIGEAQRGTTFDRREGETFAGVQWVAPFLCSSAWRLSQAPRCSLRSCQRMGPRVARLSVGSRSGRCGCRSCNDVLSVRACKNILERFGLAAARHLGCQGASGAKRYATQIPSDSSIQSLHVNPRLGAAPCSNHEVSDRRLIAHRRRRLCTCVCQFPKQPGTASCPLRRRALSFRLAKVRPFAWRIRSRAPTARHQPAGRSRLLSPSARRGTECPDRRRGSAKARKDRRGQGCNNTSPPSPLARCHAPPASAFPQERIHDPVPLLPVAPVGVVAALLDDDEPEPGWRGADPPTGRRARWRRRGCRRSGTARRSWRDRRNGRG